MKLLKVHEIISFDQTDFAKNYISMTTALRASSSSKVRKKMWKFYNNVLFGKSLQDAAKNIDVDIVWNNRRANTKIKSSRFRGRQILDPDTLAISTTPPKISRRMAFAVGFSILEFSKLEMYQVSCTLGWGKNLSSVGFESHAYYRTPRAELVAPCFFYQMKNEMVEFFPFRNMKPFVICRL